MTIPISIERLLGKNTIEWGRELEPGSCVEKNLYCKYLRPAYMPVTEAEINSVLYTRAGDMDLFNTKLNTQV